MYATKEQDHEKRKTQTGSYSVSNYLYNYLLDNYEPEQLNSSFARNSAKELLVKVGIAYARKANNSQDINFMQSEADKAIQNFIDNGGVHGDTAHNLGKRQDNALPSIKQAISDLRW